MIDVVFGSCECGLFKFALGLSMKDVYVGYSGLELGRIMPDDFDAGRKFMIDTFFSNCPKSEKEKIFRKEKKEFLEILKRAEKGESIRIWVATTPYSLCGYYHLIYSLQGISTAVYVVEIPDIGYQSPDFDRSWAQAEPDEIVKSLDLQRELTERERDEIAGKWIKLAKENAELRARMDGEVKSVPIDYFDDEIASYAPEGETIKFVQLVGETLGKSKHYLPSWFVDDRIWKMIEDGRFELISGTKNPDHWYVNVFIKKIASK